VFLLFFARSESCRHCLKATDNPKVVGSNPAHATTDIALTRMIAEVLSVHGTYAGAAKDGIRDWKSCARQAPSSGIGREPNWNHSSEVNAREGASE
jgi:hypothetical protein